ncbi:GTP pyrophosphokinase [Acetilactobacillus jinshanensis]|uniref:GTP pyrophosphokinase family protein n=1 Tax=Acetilactobacillus jinshanensis TaxID=1720083 RepID=A0A4P6ZJR5_9LACO|nr:GTP pyrophosphokinase family protein [Acetilactobacillus jinshanensis]QBP17888.1 GTP pyrophosphokinase family protein [Acetilactobacillus jinshanensis]URL60750.1 GTP pyrophosphokinase family protein [uncultured bacterium]
MVRNWKEYLLPYHQTVDELLVKLNSLKQQFAICDQHNPIQTVTGRVKSVPSIKEKMRRRYISPDRLSQDMEDIAGVRIICPLIDDVYFLVDLLRQRTDMKVVEERDYIKHQKASGYRSYHMVFNYTVQTIHGPRSLLFEIQLRTMAMDFWSTVDHALHYKHEGKFPVELEKKLQDTARVSFDLDESMSKIKHALMRIKNKK